MICDKCGYENKEGAIVCERCRAVLVKTEDKPVQEYSYGTQRSAGDAPVNGYMSYTKNSTQRPAAERSPFSGDSNSGPREWIAYAAIICGALAIYSSPTIVPGILLGISAVIFGIVGLRTEKRNIAMIGMIAGAVGVVFSVLVITAYIGIFNFLVNLLSSSFSYSYGPYGW